MSHNIVEIPADKALEWLIEGNNDYINATKSHGDISAERRIHTHHHGQNPFAVVIACSDSRVIPESIFMRGIGDLFVIRLAGNVAGDFAYGSVEYAIEHLGVNLVMVLGHTACGAVAASIEGSHDNYIGSITNEIKKAIGSTKSHLKATKLNVCNTIANINKNVFKAEYEARGVKIVGAIYHTISGHVEIL